MEQTDLFLMFTTPLEEAHIDYMATGSVASMMYGIPRFTHDLDLVIVLPADRTVCISTGFPADRFYCPPAEVLLIESRRPRRGHFNLIHHETGFKADVYIHQTDELETWGLQHKTRIDLAEGQGLWVAPPEYVILRKLEFYREGTSQKHVNDIVGMLEVSGDRIDRAVIQEWVHRRNLQPQWDEVTK